MPWSGCKLTSEASVLPALSLQSSFIWQRTLSVLDARGGNSSQRSEGSTGEIVVSRLELWLDGNSLHILCSDVMSK